MSDPAWLARAHEEMGVAETPGAASNPRVMAYFKACGSSADWVKGDSTPWCGGFVGAMMAAEGFVLPSEPLRARAWLGWGNAIETPKPGAVVVLTRGGDPASGHVALFRQFSEDRTKVYVLGGNQGDKVSILAFPVSQVLGYRWPPNAPKTTAQADPVLAEVKGLGQAGAAVATVGTAATQLPAPPVEYLAWLGTWKEAIGQLGDFASFASQHWMSVAGAAMAWTGYRLYLWRKGELKSGTVWGG